MFKNVILSVILGMSSFSSISAPSTQTCPGIDPTLTISVGGYPNFLYQTSFQEQIESKISSMLKPIGVKVIVEYHPWSVIPRFVKEYNHATVADVEDGKYVPAAFIFSGRFSIPNDPHVSLIMKDTRENRRFMEVFNRLIYATPGKPIAGCV